MLINRNIINNVFGSFLLFVTFFVFIACSEDDTNNYNYGEDNTKDVAVTGSVIKKTAVTAEIVGYVNLNLLPASMPVKSYGIEYSVENGDEEHLKGFNEFGSERASEIVGRSIKVNIEDLSPNTNYKYRTYVALTEGVVYYGEYQKFKTDDFTNFLSNSKAEVLYTAATIKATLDFKQYEIMKGHAYIAIGFFLSEEKAALDNPFDEKYGGVIDDFSFIVDYDNLEFIEKDDGYHAMLQLSKKVTDLKLSKEYYYRTYTIINGVSKISKIDSFTTTDISKMPNIFSNLYAEPSYYTASLKATVDYEKFDNEIMKIGFAWSSNKVDLEQNGSFNTTYCYPYQGEDNNYYIFTTLDGLELNTTYYYCAYSKFGNQYIFGSINKFKTKNLSDKVKDIMSRTEFVTVQGGTFIMGATSEQGSDAESDEKPAHSVTVRSFQISKIEVTQELWSAVMGSNPSRFVGNNRPVENVSWNDCQTFISKLNSITGKKYRLPTEVEWEFAARGGIKGMGYKYSGSNNIDEVAWYMSNACSIGSNNPNYGTHEVATKCPNELGIYDMSGNVYEWCSDWYDETYYSVSPSTNPTGPYSGSTCIVRGGSWIMNNKCCRISDRNVAKPDYIGYHIGLRLTL